MASLKICVFRKLLTGIKRGNCGEVIQLEPLATHSPISKEVKARCAWNMNIVIDVVNFIKNKVFKV